MKYCIKCGKIGGELYQDAYCHDCYSEIWDAGFEASSQWANDLEHTDLVGELNTNPGRDPEGYRRTVLKVLKEFDGGTWTCLKCGVLRLSPENQQSIGAEKSVTQLMSPCPQCATIGYLYHAR